MEPERLQLACEGKTRSQGGLNVDELEEITGLHGVSRDRLVEEVCKMAEDHPVKQKQQQQRQQRQRPQKKQQQQRQQQQESQKKQQQQESQKKQQQQESQKKQQQQEQQQQEQQQQEQQEQQQQEQQEQQQQEQQEQQQQEQEQQQQERHAIVPKKQRSTSHVPRVQYYSLVKSSSFRNGTVNTQFQQETEVRGTKGHRTITKDGTTTTQQLSEEEIAQLTHAPVYLPLLYI